MNQEPQPENEGTNYLRAALRRREFFCSAELVLGRDHTVPDLEDFVREASQEKNGIRIISLTDLPGGNPALLPEAFIPFVQAHGLTPVAHLTGKDGNRSFLEGRLYSLARMGAENVLALTGDAQKAGFEGKAKPVYDLDSVMILQLIRSLSEGIPYQVGSRKVRSTPYGFLSGAVVNPYKCREPDQMMQFYKLQLKLASGAQFIIPQLGFNLRKLYELRQFMTREGLGQVPVIANVYVPTETIAKMMQSGELAGCVVSDEFLRRLHLESKRERLERAALMTAAARGLGFAGAHIGGFGLAHKDFMTILDRSLEIGADWKKRIDELIFEVPGEFYLFPPGQDGMSDGSADYRIARPHVQPTLNFRFARAVHRYLVRSDALAARFFASRLKSRRSRTDVGLWRSGFWYGLLGPSSAYRKLALGCLSCGDCIQDHLYYAGCTMRWCYKGLRNGPCGGSRCDGTCEVEPERACVWNLVYLATLRAGEDPRKFGTILVPPRDWDLDQTNSLANRLAGLDNYDRRVHLAGPNQDPAARGGAEEPANRKH